MRQKRNYKENESRTEDQLLNVALKKLQMSIKRNKLKDADVLIKAIRIMFPKTRDVVISDNLFKAYWDSGKQDKALKTYYQCGRPFWLSEKVARYYEKMGLLDKAMKEYEYLVASYQKMGKDFLPLPKGPVELFKLGKWYVKRDSAKAKRYLELYLKADKIRHKRQALELVDRL